MEIQLLQNIKLSFNCPKQLNQLQACNGDWYCDGCKKIVYDFRGMGEEQILASLIKNDYEMCGLFEAGRVEVVPQQNKWLRWVSAVIVLLGLASCHDESIGLMTHRTRTPDVKTLVKEARADSSDVVMGVVEEVVPEFPGGEKAWAKFLVDNIKFNGDDYQGKVYVQFTVERDGSVTNIKILKGIAKEIDEQVIDILKRSPKWKPGIQNGKPTAAQYTMPINFTIQD